VASEVDRRGLTDRKIERLKNRKTSYCKESDIVDIACVAVFEHINSYYWLPPIYIYVILCHTNTPAEQ